MLRRFSVETNSENDVILNLSIFHTHTSNKIRNIGENILLHNQKTNKGNKNKYNIKYFWMIHLDFWIDLLSYK